MRISSTLRPGLRAGAQLCTVLSLALVVALAPVLATSPAASALPSAATSSIQPQASNVDTTTALLATAPSTTFGQAVTFTATVTPVAPATGTPTGIVTFAIDGVQVGAPPLVGGSASLSTSVLGAGGHGVTASYSGDTTFNPSAATISQAVACDTTITGAQATTVVVTGAVCVSNAQVTGGVTVSAGGSVDVENSTFTGTISATSPGNSGAIRVCKSSIAGSVTVTTAAGPVMIGDPTDGGCAVNTIKGPLTLQDNTGGTEALGNKVAGAPAVSGNSPPLEINSHAPPAAYTDNYSVVQDHTLSVVPLGVLANDVAPSTGRAALTASVVSGPSHAAPGGFTLDSNGTFTYTPAPGFHGVDTFTYRNNDGMAFSDPAMAAINVKPETVITAAKSERSPGAGVPVTAGTTTMIVYQVAVTNSGGLASGQVVVTDAVPSGAAYVAASASCGSTPACTVKVANGAITWTVASVAATTTVDLTFQVTVRPGDANNDVNNTIVSNKAGFTNIHTPGCATPRCLTNSVSNPVVSPASITVVKSEPTPGAGTPVTAGQATPISYQLAVKNSGGTASGQVVVSDIVPVGTMYVANSASCGATPGCSVGVSSGKATWTLTSVAPLSTQTLTFQVTANANGANNSTISNRARFTNVNTPLCGSPICQTKTVTNPVIGLPSVAVVKSGPSGTVTAGQATPITYQLAVSNVGGLPSGQVVVTDTIPAGTTYVPNSATCGAVPNCSAAVAGGAVTWTLSSVAPGAAGSLSFQVTVDAADANNSTISNMATFTNVNSGGCLANPTCTTNTVSNTVSNTVGSLPAIAVAKSEPTPGVGTTVTAGQATPITYQLAVTNSGGSVSGQVVVTDAIPAGTTYVPNSATCGTVANCGVAVSGGTVTWTLSSVAPGPAGSLTFQVTVDAADSNGSTISNTASFTNVNTAGCAANPTCPTNPVTNPVVTGASVSVDKSESSPGAGATVTAGQAAAITYQLPVTNSGGSASGQVVVTDAIPAGTTYVANSATCASVANCGVAVSGGTVTWTLTSVAPGPAGSLSFQVTVDAADSNGSTISNTASFTNVNTAGCSNPTCPTSTVTNPVVSPASVTVTKSGPSGNVTASVTTITYQLTVANSGGTNSGQVTITDTIPTGTTYVPNSASCGATPNCSVAFASSTVTWTLTSVASSSSNLNLTFQVTVDAADNEGSTVSNTATFTNVDTPGCSNPTCPTSTVSNMVVIPPPVVVAQSFSGAVGNTAFGVGTTPPEPSVKLASPPNLLTGDSDPTGHTLTVTAGTFSTAKGGSVAVNANGSFTYNPPVGFTGDNDTFTYTVSNGFHSAFNTVTIAVASRVWYVDSTLGTNGNGTSISPFNTLSSVTGPGGPTGAGDYIFLIGSTSNYTGGVVLKANQTLLSKSVGLVIGGHTIVTASGSNPTITNASGSPAITLAENDTIRGVNVNGTSGAGISASGVNATTIESTVAIVSTNGDGLNVNGGNGAFSVAAPITTSGTGHSVSVSNRSGGTLTLSGAVNDTGTGVTMTSNTGATINFSGGVTASTGPNSAFAATGGGTFTVTGANNTLTTTTATALNVTDTTIGTGNATFKAISSNGAPSGIVLNNTGSSGGLTVTGTGSAASGGTIQNSSNSGILATTTSNLHLSWMAILNNGNALTEDGLRMVNVFGTGELTSSTVTGSFEDNVYLSNNSGTLSAFNIQGPSCVIGSNNTASGNTGISVLATVTSTMTVTINSCAFSGNRSDTIHTDTADSSTLHATITNNVITAGTGGANQGNIGIDVSSALTSTLTYDVEGNKIGTDGVTNAPLMNHGINIFAGNNSTVTGKVINNTIRMAGAGFSGTGIRLFQSDSGILNARVSGNTVSNVGFDFGIDATDNGSGTGASTGKLNIAVANNNVSVLPAAINAIRVRGRRDTTTCTSITGNTATTNGGGGAALSISQATQNTPPLPASVYKLETPPPLGPLTDAQAQADLASLNPAAVGTEAFSSSGTGITGVAVGSCTSIPS